MSGGRTSAFAKREFALGPHPFETLKRVEAPTTYIDEARVARVPKRADMFARAQFGDMGKPVQQAAAGGYYARKSAPSMAQRRMLGALILFQDGPPAETRVENTPEANAANIKATCYFLGVDAVGLSACPDWTYYSHDAAGEPIVPYHENAISMKYERLAVRNGSSPRRGGRAQCGTRAGVRAKCSIAIAVVSSN